MTSIFEGQPFKTRPFPIKATVIWVPVSRYIVSCFLHVRCFFNIISIGCGTIINHDCWKRSGGSHGNVPKSEHVRKQAFRKKPSYTHDIVCLYTVHICTSIKDAFPSTWITHLFHFWVGQWERSYNFKLTRIPKRNLFLVLKTRDIIRWAAIQTCPSFNCKTNWWTKGLRHWKKEPNWRQLDVEFVGKIPSILVQRNGACHPCLSNEPCGSGWVLATWTAHSRLIAFELFVWEEPKQLRDEQFHLPKKR